MAGGGGGGSDYDFAAIRNWQANLNVLEALAALSLEVDALRKAVAALPAGGGTEPVEPKVVTLSGTLTGTLA